MNKYDIYSYYYSYEDTPDIIGERPGLIFDKGVLIPIAKITGAEHLVRNKNDYIIKDWKQAGLYKPSIVRLSKIQLTHMSDINKYIGHLSDEDIKGVEAILNNMNEAIEKHDELNQKIFNGDEIDPEVKDKLLEIVEKFQDSLEADKVKLDIKDVVIVGSSVSYNYTKDSDIDLHIIADLSAYPNQEELAGKLYNAYKALFNNKYDPTIYGIPVEVYVEPEGSKANSKGRYSLYNGWEQKPEKEDIPDLPDIKDDYKEWEERAKACDTVEEIDSFLDDIYKLRQQGLLAEGEFSKENLIFKEMRNNNIIKNLKDKKIELENKEMSLEEDFLDMSIFNQLTPEQQGYVDMFDFSLNKVGDKYILSSVDGDQVLDSIDDLKSAIDYEMNAAKESGVLDDLDESIDSDISLGDKIQMGCFGKLCTFELVDNSEGVYKFKPLDENAVKGAQEAAEDAGDKFDGYFYIAINDMFYNPYYNQTKDEVQLGDFETTPEEVHPKILSHKTKIKEEVIEEASEEDIKAKALADYLDISVEAIDENDGIYEVPEGEFVVYTDEEAKQFAADNIIELFNELGFEAFSDNFRDYIVNNCINQVAIDDFLAEERDYYETQEEDPEMVAYIDSLDEADRIGYVRDMFGDEASFAQWLIDNNALDIDNIVDEVILSDGRGPSLAHYDGEEIELGDDLFAYKVG